jgi:photosystem II stability/assembly factor-like uncharacterized protein
LLRLRSRFARITFACCFLSLASGMVAQQVSADLLNGLKWRLIGPFRGGRVVAVAGIPGDPATFYFGSVNGGIWKTIDAGVVWTPIFDSQKVGSIGALAVAPSDPKVIYAGTGESDIREDLSSGNGVYKSVDRGATWNHIGLEATRQISRVVIDPQNANVVYVAALGHAYASRPDGQSQQRGVFKSLDGGAHWARVLDLGPDLGVSDLAISASNPQILFAGAWNTRRAPWSAYAPMDGPGSGIYRSQDAGKTWRRLDGNGLPAGRWGRLGVDVASDGKRVYALIEVKRGETNSSDSKLSGLYRSDDGGNSWTLANADSRLTSRAWYFNRVTVDPNNSDVLYIPNVALYRSEDGGKTVSVVRGAPGGDDYHQLWIDPKSSARMVLGTDQGTSISLNRGQTWSSWYNQPTAQFYHVTTDNQFPYFVYGAQQDSGSAAVPSRTDHGQITPRDWFLPGSSESGYLAVDPSDPSIIYLSGTYGTVARFNRRTGLSQDITPWPAASFSAEINQRKYRDPWTPALVLSPTDSHTLYLGTQYVMKTVDGGLHWETISPDLTGSTSDAAAKRLEGLPTVENAKRAGYGVVFTIAPSPLDRNLIWVGSDSGLIHLTRDDGKDWKDVTPPGLSDWSKISLIEASHFDAGVAYAAVDRGRLDDQTPYIYRTRDYGANWQLITNGIPAPSFLRSIREDPQSRGLLFAGTEFGVYASLDDGDHWQSLQMNLPVTSIRDIAVHGDDLVAATFGRSFWILDNITPLRQALEAGKLGVPWLYRPATAVRIDNDSFPGTPLPPEEPTAQNPPDGAMIDYYLQAKAGAVQLEIFDAQQKLVRKFSSDDEAAKKHPPLPVAERWFPEPQVLENTAGFHRFFWDLTWSSSGGPNEDEDADYRNPSGPRATPGVYRVRLTVDGKSQEQSLKLVMDPRSPATSESLSQQLQLGLQMFGETLEARRTLAEIGSLQKQLEDLQQQPQTESTQFKNVFAQVQSALRKIMKGTSTNGPGLEDAYSALASALRVVESGDRTVPSQALAVYHESSLALKGRIEEWRRFKQTQLAELNRQLRTAGLNPVAISEIEQQVEFLMSR